MSLLSKVKTFSNNFETPPNDGFIGDMGKHKEGFSMNAFMDSSRLNPIGIN
jgi:hypothetical protein